MLLVARRKSLGVSQYELAKRLNKPQSFVAKIERYERRIDVIEFLKIAEALEIDPCEVIRSIQASTAEPPNENLE
jgi:transcriptional regulator with XRE-family HTH domain